MDRHVRVVTFTAGLAMLVTIAGPARAALASAKVPAAGTARSRGLAGHWKGQWVRDGSVLELWADFTGPDSSASGSFGSDALRALDIPFRSVRRDSAGVHWELVGDAGTTAFDGRLEGDVLAGGSDDGTGRGRFRLARTVDQTAPPYAAEDVTFLDGDVQLAGTLLVPRRAGPHPAIVFTHGSGAEGRWASRWLADRFAREGFVSLVYDKRGVGESKGDWRRASFEDLARDAAAAVRMLASDGRVRRRAIGLYGHSQGGTIAPLVASQCADVGFVIASAGIGVPMIDCERYSYSNHLGLPRLHGNDSLRAAAYVDLVVRTAYEGGDWARADSAARANANEGWGGPVPARDDVYWWLSSRTAGFDAPAYWRRVRVPVLLVYGDRDERVPVGESVRRIQAALRAGGDFDVTTRVFPGADHTFRIDAPPDGRFHWPRTPDGYLETLTGWAHATVRRR